MRKKISINSISQKKSIDEAFQDFITYKKVMNLAERSIEAYEDVFGYFTEFCSKETLCDEITQNTIFDFVTFTKSKNPAISAVSLNTYVRHLRVIFYFFMEKGYMPRFQIKLLKCEKKLKETYSDDEISRLISKPNVKACDFTELRNWAIICYLLGTGNRMSTICNVKICDIDFYNAEIRLNKVKNKRAYIIPLSNALATTLQEYLQFRKGNEDDYLFCNQFGDQLVCNCIKTAIRRYNFSRDVRKTSIHLFRNTFAKDWILNGGDIFRLQKILGHSSLDMVKEYVEMFGRDLKAGFDDFNPLDKRFNAINKQKKMSMKK